MVLGACKTPNVIEPTEQPEKINSSMDSTSNNTVNSPDFEIFESMEKWFDGGQYRFLNIAMTGYHSTLGMEFILVNDALIVKNDSCYIYALTMIKEKFVNPNTGILSNRVRGLFLMDDFEKLDSLDIHYDAEYGSDSMSSFVPDGANATLQVDWNTVVVDSNLVNDTIPIANRDWYKDWKSSHPQVKHLRANNAYLDGICKD
ncbi:MAG: hypothetical protein ACJASQ_002340 [Crocinitomicaceae bacterium]|jgi:hypothetical protein